MKLEEISTTRGLDMRSWIAVLDDGQADHAVAATKQFVRFDPAGVELGGLPLRRVKYGLALTSTRRRTVPVCAPPR